MAHLTVSVEYAVHCLLWLATAGEMALSSRDLADLQKISPSFLAKIFPKLEKAGIVTASEGVRGGYRLGRPPNAISVLSIVDAIEGDKPLFDCQEIRGRCAAYGDQPPDWALAGRCAIHAVMLKAEDAMRDELAAHSLADLATSFTGKAPVEFLAHVQNWMAARVGARKPGRRSRPPSR